MAKNLRRSSLAIRLVAAIAVALAACVALARPAEAREYEISRVDIDASVLTSGVLDVREVRTFSFDGSFNGVYFEIPTGNYVGQRVEFDVSSVGALDDGSLYALQESDSGEPGTYSVTDYSTYKEIKLYYPAEDRDVSFYVDYMMYNVVQAWADTGELYWKFVSDGWDEMSHNVRCAIHLPVPGGESVVPGENVRAWGHGTLDAEVSFEGDDIIYTVPAVGEDQFAEARVTFPADWLNLQPRSEAMLSTILGEEEAWANEANAQRAQARMFVGGAAGAVGVFGLAGIALAIFKRSKYRRVHRPQFQDQYWRDVPSEDHPAVIGVLVNDGEPGDKEFLATLMRLTDEGALGIDRVSRDKKKLFGGTKQETDYVLTTSTRSWRHALDPIDRGALSFLFDHVAPHTSAYRQAKEEASLTPDKADDGNAVLELSEMQNVAKKLPATYTEALDVWRSTVKAEAERRGFFSNDPGASSGSLYLMAVLEILAAVVGFFAFVMLDVDWIWFLLLLLPAVAAVVCIVQAAQGKPLSPEAVEVKAKAEALRRWLEDFTNLDEAVPEDVVLWNRLMVMAVVLGVADRVIEQLRVRAPQILDDPAFYPYYVWYYGPGGYAPWTFVRDAYNSSYHASQAAIAASSDSSAGGSGGGFSGGGGGGFGGGGGGGAF